MLLVAFAVVGVVAVVRLGRENYWFAPPVLGIAALCMVIIVLIISRYGSERGRSDPAP
jgi:hypothetical protein